MKDRSAEKQPTFQRTKTSAAVESHEPCFIFSRLSAALEGFDKGGRRNRFSTCSEETVLSQQLSVVSAEMFK